MIVSIIYLVIGILLTFYWYKKEYEPQYNAIKEQDIDPEDGMLNILLCMLVIFWPVKFITNLIMLKRI